VLPEGIDLSLDWDESPDRPYFTDKPGWEGYAALLLTAAYADRPDAKMPATLPGDWESDAVLVSMRARDAQTRYEAVLNPEWWLPGDFRFTFRAPGPTGHTLHMGSNSHLV